MPQQDLDTPISVNFGPLLAISTILYLTTFYSFLLFHTVVEFYSIIIAGAFFAITWNCRRWLDNNYLLFLGIAYLFVAVIDFMHVLAYKGMGVFSGVDGNLATQLWIAARYLQSISLLLAPWFLGRKLKADLVFAAYVVTLSVLTLSIFYWQIFPDCFFEGRGLTTFKKVSEYVISLILVAAIALLVNNRHWFAPSVFKLLVGSMLATIVSEIAFTFYVNVYGLSNIVGHYGKIAAFYCLYRAVIVTGLSRPYLVLFRQLKLKEESLQQLNEALESKVNQRTQELSAINHKLESEIVRHLETEAALRQSESNYRIVADNTYDWEFWLNPAEEPIYVSPSCQRITGYLPEAFIAHPQLLEQIVYPEDQAIFLQHRHDVEYGDVPGSMEFRIVRADGEIRWIGHVCQAVYNDKGQYCGRRGSNRDITERKNLEEIIRQNQEENLQLIISAANLGTWNWNIADDELKVNDRFLEIIGYSRQECELTISFWEKLVFPEDSVHNRQQWREHVQGMTEFYRVECRVKTRQGDWKWVMNSGRIVERNRDGKPLVAAGVTQDIDAAKREVEKQIELELQIQKAKKLESLERMGSAIAHRFNNLLMVISGRLEMFKAKLPKEMAIKNQLEAMEKAVCSAVKLSKSMLIYVGQGGGEKKPLDLLQLIHDLKPSLEASLPFQITLQTDLPNSLPLILADQSQLRQALLHLFTNAWEAIGEEKGNIKITAGVVTYDRDYPLNNETRIILPAAEYVMISIADSGCGMDQATLEKIFDPFFSTKFTGRGLGLAATLGIMRSHKGAIEVSSQPGSGTTIILFLPSVANRERIMDHNQEKKQAIPDGNAGPAVLLVDDDSSVLEVTQAMLERLGFSVLTAHDGHEAINMYKKQADKIDCVLLDLAMPVMNGRDTYRELKKIQYDTPVIISSGLIPEQLEESFADDQPAGFIRKPYRLDQLEKTLQQVLGQVPGS